MKNPAGELCPLCGAPGRSGVILFECVNDVCQNFSRRMHDEWDEYLELKYPSAKAVSTYSPIAREETMPMPWVGKKP